MLDLQQAFPSLVKPPTSFVVPHRASPSPVGPSTDAVWSRSFRLFLGGKGKTGWILDHHPKPATSDPTYPKWDIDNCTILGWLFNSMEDIIYHMFIYNDTIQSLWTALSQMYAHAHHDSQIFDLYIERLLEPHKETLEFSVADYFGFLQSRWEELAQYEHLGDFLTEASVVVAYYRLRLLPPLGPPIIDQMAFAASSGSGPRSSDAKPTCSYCTPTAFHAKTGHPTWILDSRVNDHMIGLDFEEDFWQGI
ncbi:hypothetical protein Acr_00g0008280 [Actinidia rufa]|uniref:Uncharacterized protein n=1 Tax=Actinidia rufa TaxID=165716 RepID=A0A7J0D8K9_9ERIC|nr:hypothetical protein Acr_00g0008280 [Actinidia rufa]